MKLYTNSFVEDRINLTFETLDNISHEKSHRPHEIYNLTTHSTRYSILGFGLNVLSMPVVVISGFVKFFSSGIISLNNIINIPKILKDKMDQGISKKILYAFDEIDKQELVSLCHKILKQWTSDPSLVLTQEETYFTKIKNYMFNNITYLGQIKNFWIKGGINYSEDQINQQQLIKIITNEIFQLGYTLGKKASYLSIDNIYQHFINLGAYEDNSHIQIEPHNDDFQDLCISKEEQEANKLITQTVDLIDFEEDRDTEYTKQEVELTSSKFAINESVNHRSSNSSNNTHNSSQEDCSKENDSGNHNDVTNNFITDDNREQVLLNVKEYLTTVTRVNSNLRDIVDQYLDSLQCLSNQELSEKIISDYKLLQSELQNQTTIHKDENILVPYMSCGQKALKEEIDLAGKYNEVQGYEIVAYVI